MKDGFPAKSYGVAVAKLWGRRCKVMGSLLQTLIGPNAATDRWSSGYAEKLDRVFWPCDLMRDHGRWRLAFDRRRVVGNGWKPSV